MGYETQALRNVKERNIDTNPLPIRLASVGRRPSPFLRRGGAFIGCCSFKILTDSIMSFMLFTNLTITKYSIRTTYRYISIVHTFDFKRQSVWEPEIIVLPSIDNALFHLWVYDNVCQLAFYPVLSLVLVTTQLVEFHSIICYYFEDIPRDITY